MFKELLESFKGNINTKIRNPFLGTMSFIYILKNWELFYVILTLDTSIDINKRLEVIKPIFQRSIGLLNLLQVLGVTIIVFLFSYFLLTFSRLIVQFVNKKVNPRVDKLTDDKSIIAKPLYDKLLKDHNELKEAFEIEHNSVQKLREERNNLQEKILELTNTKREPATKENKPKEKNEQSLLFSKLLNIINSNNWDSIFDKIITSIRSNSRIDNNDPVLGELLKYSMVERHEKYPQARESNVYLFTDIGNEFVQYYILTK